MDYSQSQQQKRCNTVLLSPAQTPRSSVRRSLRDSLSMDLWSSNIKPDRGVNVEVILRCRPLNDDEKQLKLPVVISCNEGKGEVSVVQNTAYKQIDKTFSFDKVFGPTSQQKELFDEAISPIVNEVLEGYNCTIFAYGQTGTGKTYTMEGGRVGVVESGEFPSDVGIIPRAVQQILDVLEARNEEYSMKVTFLELYNEDIMDLLAPDESLNGPDDKSRKPIALMEDGRGGVFIRGLEQEVVCTADGIYKILEKGSAKRHTADSLLNMQSSRSHTIFSITIHVKESSSNGEELMKCGKLNLVDLAGSENVVRSGAKEGRVREAGEINKSLLTLGRVINALVEHSGHVPYRDSKLTRLLRDSLGGNTKTCIIATVSPSIHSLEETLNTLDYAHRAKKIKNRPEVNQRVAKSELIKDLYKEIDRHRQEIYAEREKNGICIPHNRFQSEEAERKALVEQIKNMEFDLAFKDKELIGLQKLYDKQQTLTAELSEKLQMTQKDFEKTQNTLIEIEGRNRKTNAMIKEKEHLISHLLQSEKTLTKQALELREELEHAASEASNLFSKLELQDKLENGNKILVQKFQTQLAQQLDVLHLTVAASVTQQEEHLKSMEKDFNYSLSKKMGGIQELTTQVRHLKNMHESSIKSLDDISEELDMSYRSVFSNLTSEVSRNSSALVGLLEEKFQEINDILDDVQRDLFNQQEKLAEFAEQQRQGHSKTLQLTSSMSEAMMKFFETLGTHTSSLSRIMEGTQKINGQKLYDLAKEFEDCAAFEKRQLLEKVAELLDISNDRKKNLVQTAINSLLESTASRTCKLQNEMSNLQDFSCSVKSELTTHMETIATSYLVATAVMDNGKDGFEKCLQQCVSKARMGVSQLRNAQESVLDLQKRNVGSLDSIARNELETSGMILSKVSSFALSALEETGIAYKYLLSSIENLLKLDHDAHKNIRSVAVSSFEDMKGSGSNHYHTILKIKEGGQCFLDEYKVDEPYCLTLEKRSSNTPSRESIEELRNPTFQKLSRTFSGDSSVQQESGDQNILSDVCESAHPLNNSRVTLTAIN
ncbi:hypothetical protein POTOM_052771 [Populus tomentosa]|uniref:Kinesin motor domain-containing protein n=1 Tax=Populus tomentosa TaxID=118781 RepID=A0A8X7Y8B7_POPTO|nr:hypothetical protein POTOM_052771 [Populus tomentosa]